MAMGLPMPCIVCQKLSTGTGARCAEHTIKRSAGLIRSVKRATGGRLLACAHCGLRTREGAYDHIVPLFTGGADAVANLQWLCKRCHRGKTTDDAERYAAR